MKQRFVSRLRAERLRWGLTQRELAPLLCIQHVSQLSRIEHGTRKPSAVCLIATSVLFEKSVVELFPGLTKEITERIGRRAVKLYLRVEHKHSVAAGKKRDLLSRIARVPSDV